MRSLIFAAALLIVAAPALAAGLNDTSGGLTPQERAQKTVDNQRNKVDKQISRGKTNAIPAAQAGLAAALAACPSPCH